MIQIEDVKTLSHRVVESHNARGFSLVKIAPTGEGPVGVLLNMTKEPLVREGRQLRAKADIRAFLWDLSQNQNPCLRRKGRTWIWSRYLKDENVSMVGLATETTRDVAEKLAARDENYQFIEVGQ